MFALSQWLRSLVALQCDITHRLTKSSIPSKANTTNVVIKSEPKQPLIDEKPKEKKEEAPEISLETNEKMIIDDDVAENPVIKEEGYVSFVLRSFYSSFDNIPVAYYQHDNLNDHQVWFKTTSCYRLLTFGWEAIPCFCTSIGKAFQTIRRSL